MCNGAKLVSAQYHTAFVRVALFSLFCISMSSSHDQVAIQNGQWSLESVRNSLIRQEDTIIFSLIERAKYQSNRPLYDQRSPLSGTESSFLELFVKDTEAVQAKFGRYENPEEHPFFSDGLPKSLVPPLGYEQVLHPAAASVSVNKIIWDVYINQLLPLLVSEGVDASLASIAAQDLECLQALSRRIHYGMFVAEVKFKDDPEVYTKAIQAQDRDGLMKLLTFKTVEEQVVKRVEKKTMVFGQDVTVADNESHEKKYKVDPSVVGTLYKKWVMPLTKEVQVEYLLRRLD